MLILRGLSALFVGLTAVTQAAPSDLDSAGRLQLPRLRSPRANTWRANGEDLVESPGVKNEHRSSLPAQFIRLPRKDTLHRRRQDSARRRLFSRNEDCSSSTSTACSAGRNETGLACEICPLGFKCCTSSTGAGACCPDESSTCEGGDCSYAM